jgi:predicted secreted protein
MAFFPSIWRKVMHPIIDAHQKGKKIDKKVQEEINRTGMLFIIAKSVILTLITF